jgi:hypothetical protein
MGSLQVSLTARRGDRHAASAPVMGHPNRLSSDSVYHRCRHAIAHAHGLDRHPELIRPCRNGFLQWRRIGDGQTSGGRGHRETLQAGHGLRRDVGGATQHKLLPPSVELPAADAVPARHHGRRRPRFQAVDHNPALLLSRPTTTAIAAGAQLGIGVVGARMTSRQSGLSIQEPVVHRVVLRNARHLPLPPPGRAM